MNGLRQQAGLQIRQKSMSPSSTTGGSIFFASSCDVMNSNESMKNKEESKSCENVATDAVDDDDDLSLLEDVYESSNSNCTSVTMDVSEECCKKIDKDEMDSKRDVELATEILRHYTMNGNEPIGQLNNYYQKRGISKVQSYFVETFVTGSRTFYYSFECPLTHLEYRSGLPRPLFEYHHHASTKKGEGGGEEDVAVDSGSGKDSIAGLIELAKEAFGTYLIGENSGDQVSFGTKKTAKKALAIAVLQQLKPNTPPSQCDPLEPFIVPSIAIRNGQKDGEAQHDDSSNVKQGRDERIPSWCHKLYDVGVSTVNITYEQYVQHSDGGDPSCLAPLWAGKPTQICCVMETNHKITTMGKPSLSRRKARDSAASCLVEEIERRGRTGAPIDESKRIPFADSEFLRYWKPLPAWATMPPPNGSTVDADATSNSRRMYLYRLSFLSPDDDAGERPHDDFLKKRMGLQNVTPMGILFPHDLPAPPSGQPFRANFPIVPRGKRKSEGTLMVELSKVSERYHTMEDLTDVQLNSLQEFNIRLCSWHIDYSCGGIRRMMNKVNLVKRDNRQRDPCGRTYLFVPLVHESQKKGGIVATDYTIDFDLINRVVNNNMHPFLTKNSLRIAFSWVCTAILTVYYVVAAISMLMLLSVRMDSFKSLGLLWQWCSRFLPITTAATAITRITTLTEVLIGDFNVVYQQMLLPVLLLSIFKLYLHLYPQFYFTPERPEIMANRFFIEEGKQSGQTNIHVLPLSNDIHNSAGFTNEHYWRHNKSGTSRYSDQLPLKISNMDLAMHKTKYNIDLNVASYAKVYRNKFKVKLRYPRSRLVQSLCVTKHGDRDFLFHSSSSNLNNDASRVYLFPEMIRILPLPRDFLYIFSQASRFMPLLERQIYLQHTAASFRTIANRAPFDLLAVPTAHTTTIQSEEGEEGEKMEQQRHNFVHLLDAATKPGPQMERLEFLGDTVLGYFVGINEFARNSSLSWDADDFRNIHSIAVSNKTLDRAGRKGAGLGQIFWPESILWRSFYDESEATQLQNPLRIDRDAKGLPFPIGHVTFRVNKKRSSDMVEAILAACYLHGRSSSSDGISQNIVLGLMELLNLPMLNKFEKSSRTTPQQHPWFFSKNSCIDQGYSFDLDSNWNDTIHSMSESLNTNENVLMILQDGRRALVKLLGTISPDSAIVYQTLECHRAKLLLHCALYDDSHADEKDLEVCALFRDSLHRVGHDALQLSISREIFSRYPSATERDMTVQRLSAISHDIVVYVMFKAGIHRFLFDQYTTSLVKFQALMEDADRRGAASWSQHGGWILGLEEFHKRCNSAKSNNASLCQQQPRYTGIGGGRLLGQQRLDDSITEDLCYSMKTIVGALVLVMGLDGMWSCLRPIWEETLLLSAEEIRQHFGASSSAVMNYWKRDC